MTIPRRPGTTGIEMFADEHPVADIEFDDDDDEDELFLEEDDDYFYDDRYGDLALRPEWMHPKCVDPSTAMEHGTCCKYPADLLVRRALGFAEAVDQALRMFDVGEGGQDECKQAASDLTRLFECVPEFVAEIRAALPRMDKMVAAQLLCPIGRLSLLSLELARRSGCPWACSDHGAPDRRQALAPLASLLEDCDEALWAAVLPKPRRRR